MLGTQQLLQAVDAFQTALAERTREKVPLDWAATQENLGIALRILGERESGTQLVAASRGSIRTVNRSLPGSTNDLLHKYRRTKFGYREGRFDKEARIRALIQRLGEEGQHFCLRAHRDTVHVIAFVFFVLVGDVVTGQGLVQVAVDG